MSISKSSSKSKKSVSESSVSHVTLAASATAPAIAPATAPSEPLTSPATSASLGSIVLAATKQLDALEAGLNLNIVIRPNDKDQMRALARVSDTALGLASDIVTAAPSRFPDFTGIPSAAEYVTTMQPLLDRATLFATHVQNSIANQRTPASQQTLALYAVVKGLGRIVNNQTMREKVTALKTEVAPRLKNPKPKVTKEEKAAKTATKARASRLAKAIQVLAENGVAVPPASPAPVPSAPAPVAAPVVTVPAAPQPPVVSAPAVTNGGAQASSTAN